MVIENPNRILAIDPGTSHMGVAVLEEDDLIPDTAGVRPKIKNGEFSDFVIKEESRLGLDGLINLIGIESPGLTSCLSIAKYVEGMVEKLLR